MQFLGALSAGIIGILGIIAGMPIGSMIEKSRKKENAIYAQELHDQQHGVVIEGSAIEISNQI